MMLCERDESVQERVLKNTKKMMFFSNPEEGGPKGPLFRGCCKNLQRADELGLKLK
jgi:hypothetical protein